MSRLFIANRGEVARRIIRSARARGMTCVVPHVEAESALPYVLEADRAVLVDAPRDFVDAQKMVALAVAHGATAVHPGYGFMSESPSFAAAVVNAGLVWVGPPARTIALMGDKAAAREHMSGAGVPVVPGSVGAVDGVEDALAVAQQWGFPVMVKPVAGGGGIGMAVARNPEELRTVWATAQSRGRAAFGDGRLLVEKFVARSRHVEVQVVGLPDGRVIALSERDCSLQRRHQKVVEESPSPGIHPDLRARLLAAAEAAARSVEYLNVGTVEFLLDLDSDEFYFLEMNTRLQVEHPVTEMVHGIDLVDWQLEIAEENLPDVENLATAGHAIELRVYAEDPYTGRPGPGPIERWVEPRGNGVRVDSGYATGNVITAHFDPLLAKVVVWGGSRAQAIDRARRAVADFEIAAPRVNLELLDLALASQAFEFGCYDTSTLAELIATRPVPER